MPAARTIDFNRPETTKDVGADLAATNAALVQRLIATTVTDAGSLQQAVIDREDLAAAMGAVTGFFAPFKKMADALHKSLCAREREILAPLLALDAAKRAAIGDYKRAQDREREQRERDESDRQRREQQDRAAREAAQLEAAGDHALAKEVIEEAIAAPAPIVALPDVTRGVVKFRKTWRWRYMGGPNDIKATPPRLIERTMQLIPREYCCVDDLKVGAYVRAMKSSAKIPGIEIYSTEDPIR